MDQKDQLDMFVKGTVIGCLVGDALGLEYTDVSPIPDELDFITGAGGELPGEYTSLSAFALSTMSSLLECEELDNDNLMEKLYDTYIGGYMTTHGNCYDVGTITTNVIKNYSNGIPVDKCPLGTYDEEFLPRILPVSLYYITEPIDVIVNKAHQSCKLTHRGIECQVLSAIYCLVIRNLILQKSEKVFDTLESYYEINKQVDYVESLKRLKTREFGSSFWIAWDAFSKYENDCMFTITESIQISNDKNLTGAIAGSLASAANGLGNIPSKWLRGIQLTTEVMEIVMKFSNKVINDIVQ